MRLLFLCRDAIFCVSCKIFCDRRKILRLYGEAFCIETQSIASLRLLLQTKAGFTHGIAISI